MLNNRLVYLPHHTITSPLNSSNRLRSHLIFLLQFNVRLGVRRATCTRFGGGKVTIRVGNTNQ